MLIATRCHYIDSEDGEGKGREQVEAQRGDTGEGGKGRCMGASEEFLRFE